MTANEIVAHLKSLAPVSPAGLKLINLLDQNNQENSEIIEILKYDSVLTAKVLRLCNSPYYGFNESIASIDQAVLMLGYEKIARIILPLCFGGAMGTPLEAYAFAATDLWRHSFVTALAAETLAQDGLIANMEPSAAFTAGLLHDIGKLAFNQVLAPDLISSLRHQIDAHGLSRIEAERQIIGTDHAEVGACMLHAWKLPPEIVEAVANHHQPVIEPQPRLSAVTCLANSVAHLSGSAPGWEAYADKMDRALVAALQLKPEKVESLMITVRESFDRVEQCMVMT
jgi:putative nucleotidyltransferase with HDIG domain